MLIFKKYNDVLIKLYRIFSDSFHVFSFSGYTFVIFIARVVEFAANHECWRMLSLTMTAIPFALGSVDSKVAECGLLFSLPSHAGLWDKWWPLYTLGNWDLEGYRADTWPQTLWLHSHPLRASLSSCPGTLQISSSECYSILVPFLRASF